jgi:hypothetical protein
VSTLDRRVVRIEEAAGIAGRHEILGRPRAREIVIRHWNPEFGAMTAEAVEAHVTASLDAFQADVASGTPEDEAAIRAEALCAVLGSLTAEQLAALVLKGARRRSAPDPVPPEPTLAANRVTAGEAPARSLQPGHFSGVASSKSARRGTP